MLLFGFPFKGIFEKDGYELTMPQLDVFVFPTLTYIFLLFFFIFVLACQLFVFLLVVRNLLLRNILDLYETYWPFAFDVDCYIDAREFALRETLAYRTVVRLLLPLSAVSYAGA